LNFEKKSEEKLDFKRSSEEANEKRTTHCFATICETLFTGVDLQKLLLGRIEVTWLSIKACINLKPKYVFPKYHE
jgi:hypothetical protein